MTATTDAPTAAATTPPPGFEPPPFAALHAALTMAGSPFETVEVDVRGVPTRVWKDSPPHLPALLLASREHGDRDYLVYDDMRGEPLERLTYEQHFQQAATLAHRLRDRHGVQEGDRVAIAMRNLPEWVLTFWGASAAGAVVVPLNSWGTGDELDYALRDSGTTVLVCDDERYDRLQPYLEPLGLTVFVTRGEREGTLPFADLVRDPEPGVALPDVDLSPEDYATIFYTSGTTGRPKGVLGSHRNIAGSPLGLRFSAARTAFRSGMDLEALMAQQTQQAAPLLSVPLFHATGCHASLVGGTSAGSKITIMRKWDADRALHLIETERITSFGGVPSMVLQVLDSPKFAETDISSVTGIGYGGAPAPPDLVRRLDELFPGRIPSNGYGMTETSALAIVNAGLDYANHPDSVGVPIAVCDARVVDPLGEELPRGEAGELEIKGPNVVVGYWGNEQATRDAFHEGWLRTGDVAKIDEEGFVYLVDRAKDLVIRGGENIGSAEVEGVLHEHPAVADAAVFGIPHPVLGEEVAAVVRLRPGVPAPDEQALQAHVRERLAGFKVPSRIWFREDELPRNAAGKLLKRALRTEFVEG